MWKELSGKRSFDDPDPEGVSHFDLVLSLTLAARLSAGDSVHLSVTYCQKTSPPTPCARQVMSPGEFPVSGEKPFTTTLTWAIRSLSTDPAEGYIFQLNARPIDRSSDQEATVLITKMTAVFEMWPSRRA